MGKTALFFAATGLSLAGLLGDLKSASALDTSSRVPLYWEDTTRPHPERASWSDALLTHIEERFGILDKAGDMAQFCPAYANLDHSEKVKAWGELMVGDALYESGFDPKQTSVDVGKKSEPDTWSIGLWQVSVVDQSWAMGVTKYSYDELLEPGPNADLAVAEIAYQINKSGLIVVPKNPTFATLYHGKYDEISKVAAIVRKNVPGCNS